MTTPRLKRLLIVTPRWIPNAAPDLQRVRMSLPYYRSLGWEPILLTVDPRHVETSLEPDLAQTIPDDITVYRCGALSRRWTRFIGLGSLGIRAFHSLYRTGREILEREKIDLVFVSTTEFLVTTIARRWQKETGVPYVIDLQDPWRTSHYEQPNAPKPPGGWKYQIARFLAWALEERSFARAAGFISVSPHYLHSLSERYTWFKRRLTTVIPFGSSPKDFEAAGQVSPRPRLIPRKTAHAVHLVYTGAVGPALPDGIEALFGACQDYLRNNLALSDQLYLHFIGSRYVSSQESAPDLQPYAERFGLTAQVHEIPHRVGYLESLRWQLEGDALILLGSRDPAYSPSKLFTYLRSGKPILALVIPDSHLEQLLSRFGGAFVVRCGPTVAAGEVNAGVKRFLDSAFASFPMKHLPFRDEATLDAHFGPAALTARQCAFFEETLTAITSDSSHTHS